MKLLVTGGMGFIGSNFIRYILFTRKDVEVTNLDNISIGSNPANLKELKKDRRYNFVKGSILDLKLVSKLVKKVDVLINCAAQTHVDRSIANPAPFMESNTIGTYNILEAARRSSPATKIVHVSTDEIYGDIPEGSFKEDDRLKPSSPYCLPPDARVLLENGKEINIEDMVEAKKVVSLLLDNGKEELTSELPLGLAKREYHGDLVEIVADHGKLRCTPEHRLLIKRPKRYGGKLDCRQNFSALPVMEVVASDIRKGDWLICPRKVNFAANETYGILFWRFAGYFTGDGSVSVIPRYYHRYVKLADSDKGLLTRYKDMIEEMTYDKEIDEKYDEARKMSENADGRALPDDAIRNFAEESGLQFHRVKHWFRGDRKPRLRAAPSFYKHKSRNCWYLSFGHKKTIDLIERMGLTASASLKSVPDVLFDSTDEEISEFLAGLYDADGSYHHHVFSIHSVSLRLLEGARRLLTRLGIVSTIHESSPSKKGYRLIISDNLSKNLFLEKIKIFKRPKNVRIGKSQERMFRDKVHYSAVRETKRVKSNQDCVYDMEVHGSHNFVANGFFVHNSASKSAADMFALAYHRTYGLNVTVTRCTNNFGPYQHPEKLIPKTIIRAASNLQIPVYGKGDQIRDWIYVKDHCDALIQIMEKGIPGEIYNISAGNEMPNLKVVESILGLMGKTKSLIELVHDRPGHDVRYSLDSTKIRTQVGWKPKHKFTEALETTVRWYMNNESWWKPLATRKMLHPTPWTLKW